MYVCTDEGCVFVCIPLNHVTLCHVILPQLCRQRLRRTSSCNATATAASLLRGNHPLEKEQIIYLKKKS